MTKRFESILLIGILISVSIMAIWIPAASAAFTPPASNRTDLDLNSTWKFNRADVSGAQNVTFDDSAWTSISLPHTWNNLDGQDGGSNYYRGIGWYRKHYTVDSAYNGRSIFLKFDGANTVSDVYVNGNYLGQHKGGFAAFCFDVTPYINFGADNVIAVKVNNAYNADIPPLSADFTFFGGIYRGVHLLVTDKLGVTPLDYASPGVYLKTTNVSAASADLQITAKIKNNYSVSKNVSVYIAIVDAGNNVVKTLTATQSVGAGANYDFVQNTTIATPHLWNGLSDPYLYRAYVEVMDGSTVVDLVDQPLGFRFYSVDPNNGFFLNGNYLDLHGVNRHQDRLNMGWAIGPAEHLEDFNLIKEMGATAIRLAHYQHAEYFYQLGDSGGMVVWAEFPFVNNVTVSTGFYDNAKQELTELIRQNYNHPCIFFWGIGNEIAGSPDPNPLMTQLNDLVHAEDPTRLTTYASNVTECAQSWHTDVTGFNRYDGWYSNTVNDFAPWADTTHASHPTVKMGVSEYGAGSSISFHSQNPVEGDHTEEYQCYFHETYWKAMMARKFLWGKFIWNMFDFAADARNEGDTPGRNDKGMVTYDRKTKKDVFFYYQANWTNTPVVYITSRRFDYRTSAVTDIKIYSNCDSVELKVNGVSQGSKTGTSDKIFLWTGVTLANGANTIQAIGTKNSVQYTDSCTWNLGGSPTPTPTATPSPDGSLSQGKTVYASSSQTGNAPQNANDNNMGTRWAASDGTYPQWWTVDLGSALNITRVDIYWYSSNNRAYQYKIGVSNDNTTFTTTVDKSGNTTYGDTSDSFTATARYVRVTVTGCTTGTAFASANEIKVFGSTSGSTPTPTPVASPTPTQTPVVTPTPTRTATPTPTATSMATPTATGTAMLLSQGKTASASNNQAGNTPAGGNDGSATTRWAASDNTYPQWWKVDLGAVKNLTRTDITWYSSSNRAYKYKIETSGDDVTYTTAVDKTGNTAYGDTSDSFTATARYVRITVTGCTSGAAYASFYECKVYGY